MVQLRNQRRYLAERLRRRLIEIGINQSDLARKMGTSRDNVSGWAGATSFPRPAMIEKLAEALGSKVEDLVPPELIDKACSGDTTFQLVIGKDGTSKVRMEAELPAEAAIAIYNILRDARVIS